MTDAPFEQPPRSGATTAVEPPSAAPAMSHSDQMRQPDQMGESPQAGGSPSGTGGTVATIAEETRSHGGELAHEAVGEVRTFVGAATDQARSLAGTARQQLAREADDATTRAADAMASTANDLTSLARGEGGADSPAADVVRQIGEKVDEAAARLRDGGYQGVVEDVSRWARNHPGAFLLAAAGAGFAIGRAFRTVDTGAVLDATKDAAQPSDDLSDGDRFDGSGGSGAGRPDATSAAAGSFPTVGGAAGGPGPEAVATPGSTIDLTADPAWREASDLPARQPSGGPTAEGRP